MPGYRLDILVDAKMLQRQLLCGICMLLLKLAVHSTCGHRFCQSCLQEIIRSGAEQVRCPMCEHDSEEGILNEEQIYPDFHARKELKTLQVKCCNKGCKWKGIFQEYAVDHEPSCIMATITCRNVGCGKILKRSDMTHHLEKDCPMRTITCRNCGEDILHRRMKKHPSVCPKAKITCSDCGIKISRDLLKGHQDYQSGDCPNKAQHCLYEDYGCNFTVSGPGMDEHLQSEIVYHTQLKINKYDNLIDEMKSRIQTQETKLGVQSDLSLEPIKSLDSAECAAAGADPSDIGGGDISESKLDYLLSIFTPMFVAKAETSGRDSSSTSKSGEHRTIPKSAASVKLDNKIRDLEAKSHDSGRELSNIKTLYEVLGQRNDTFQEVVTVFNTQMEQQLEKLQKLQQQFDRLKESVDEKERKLNAQDQLLAVKSVTLMEQDLRLQSLQVPAFKGVLVWLISDFSQKRDDAINGRTLSFYSHPFYTSFHGYKMCARIYLNGDGMGKGTHISLFFVVMKGEYDNILVWPFKQKVTLKMMDQGNREHVVDSFRPDHKSSSFKKPTGDMNVASGCPMFANLNLLENDDYQYVKDNCMFIKIVVDISDLERM